MRLRSTPLGLSESEHHDRSDCGQRQQADADKRGSSGCEKMPQDLDVVVFLRIKLVFRLQHIARRIGNAIDS
jgi:hypothetical protein